VEQFIIFEKKEAGKVDDENLLASQRMSSINKRESREKSFYYHGKNIVSG
jgi:hypothetical protein